MYCLLYQNTYNTGSKTGLYIFLGKKWSRSEKNFILSTLYKLTNDLKTVKTTISFTHIYIYLQNLNSQ